MAKKQEDVAAPEAAVEGINGAADAVAEAQEAVSKKRQSAHQNEMPVSTLLHLMGLPTNSEIQMLESKLDLLTSKLTRIALQVERMGTQFTALADNLYMDRIDFQLADLRNVIKKLFPKAMASGEIAFEENPDNQK